MKKYVNIIFNPVNREKAAYLQLPGFLISYAETSGKYKVTVVYFRTGLKKTKIFGFLLTVVLVMLISGRVLGQDISKNTCLATYINNPPDIDGVLNEEAWKDGIWYGNFTQNEPYNNKPVSQKTDFKILYDDNNIYIAVRSLDIHPDSIVQRLTRRDQVEGDVVAILIDSYHDLRTAFFFGVSAAGVKYDMIYTNDGQNQDPSWDPDWWVRTSINSNGWVAEMKIPLNQIRFEKNSDYNWGLQVARLLYRKNEIDFWQHIPKDVSGIVHMFGELSGLDKIKPHKIFDVTPYVVTKAETYRAQKENPFRNTGRDYNLKCGIDTKTGITNNLTLDMTINPDFGQVEADPSEVNLTVFETFHNEQRPFFIEGNNITDFNLGVGDARVGNDNLFYSRRIGRAPQVYPGNIKNGWTVNMPTFTNILGAAKLTGKTREGLSLGFMDALTNAEKAEVDTLGGKIYRTVEPLTNYFVGRIQKDFNSGKTIIGGIFTATNRGMDSTLASVLDRNSYAGGFDITKYIREKSWMINLNAAFSYVEGTKEAIKRIQESSARYYQRPDNDYVNYNPQLTSLTGSGGRLQVMKLNGHLNMSGIFLWRTPGFETNDLGYLRQADQLVGIINAGYNQWEPKGIYNRYSINCGVYSLLDFGGDFLVKAIEPNANITFRNYWNAYVSGSISTDQLSTTLLRGGPLMKIPGFWQLQYGFSSDNRRKVIISVNDGRSGQYQNSSGSRLFGFNIQFKPADFLMFSLGPQSNTTVDHLQYITTLNYNNNTRYIFATIHQKTISVSFRVNLNLSPNLSIQYWGQPFLASGKYSSYKYITDPVADKYTDRFHIYSKAQIIANGNGYDIDEGVDGQSDYHLGINDFNYQSFLSNLVVRWEYNPGSTLFFVWSQTRNGYADRGSINWKDIGSLSGIRPSNIFVVKFSYRFGSMYK